MQVRGVYVGPNEGTVEELRTFSNWLMEVQEKERQSIAKELHAEVAQYLATLKLFLDEATKDPSSQKSISGLKQAQATVKGLLKRVLDLSFDLRPNLLDDLGLLPALLWYFERYTALTQIEVKFNHTGLDRTFAADISTAAYRIMQDALTNIAHNTGIRKVSARVWVNRDELLIKIASKNGSHSTLTVENPNAIVSVRERVLSVGGKLKVHSEPGICTVMMVALPLLASKARRQT